MRRDRDEAVVRRSRLEDRSERRARGHRWQGFACGVIAHDGVPGATAIAMQAHEA